MRFIFRPITALGAFAIWWLEFTGGLGYLLRDTAASIHRALIAKRGRRLGWRNLWAQMVRVGVRSIPIVSLVDRKSTRLNSSHLVISYAVFCLKKKIL